MRKTLFVFNPQPASHLSAVTSHSGCTNAILQASIYFRKCATAIQKSTLFLFSGYGDAIGCAERYPGGQGEKRREGGTWGD